MKILSAFYRYLCFLPGIFAILTAFPRNADAASFASATLKNGLRVVVVRNSLAPVVTTQVNYLVGSNEAPPGFPGMAHAQEHMMFRGSPGLSADQLASIMAAMGGEFNANTQKTVTQYISTVAVKDLETALHVEVLRMSGILDKQKLWMEERGAIEQEVAEDLSDPEYLLDVQLSEKLYEGTPYSLDSLGTKASFDKTTGAMLKKFYDDWYTPNNAILIIAGAVEPEQTLAMVKRLFEPIPSRPVPSRTSVVLRPLKPAAIKLKSDLSYGLSVVAYRFPGYESPEYAAGQVLGEALESQRGNLYALVPAGKALFTDFDISELPKASTGYATAAFPYGEDGTALIGMIKKIIADYVKNGVPVELVEAAKRHMLAQAEFQKNSVEGMADAWSQAIAIEGRSSPDDDCEAIKKVTVKDVNRVARAFLVNDTAVTALLVPRQSGKPIEVKNFHRGNESFPRRLTKQVKLPSWALGVTKSPVAIKVEEPTVFNLANGLRLIVQTAKTSQSVSIYGRVKNNPDLQAPRGKEGVDELLDGLFSFGTTTLDRLSFQAALDEIAADFSAGTSFSLEVREEHFDRGVELLADALLHPALPEGSFKVVRKATVGVLTGQQKSPSWLAGHALKEALYPKGDPAQRQATPETVAKLTLDDVKNYYRTVFRPDMTTMVVIGDISPAKAKAIIDKYFGSWRAEGPKPETEYRPVPANRPKAMIVPDDMSRLQSEVTLAETLALTRMHPDYYKLQVGLHVLTGAFYATRLYRDLREQAGLVYAVEAFLHAGKTRSTFEVSYGCDPGNVYKARMLIERDLKEMQQHPVTQSELRQAKTLLLRSMLLSRISTNSIANELLDLSSDDLPLNEPIYAAQQYENVTASQVKAAFSKWIRLHDFVQITRGSE